MTDEPQGATTQSEATQGQSTESETTQSETTQGEATQGGAQRGADQGTDDLYERGMEVRRAVLGDAHVDRAVANTTDFTAPFQEFITRYAWGGVWTRDGLDRRTRSVITLSVLTALGRENEIAMHVRAAVTNGLSQAEIAEILIHTAVYAGVPASNAAFAIAQRVFEEG